MSRATLGFKDDSNGTLAGDPVDDYQYDLNGNMITDQNKNITSITYNHLNLPTKITFSTGSNIVYVYDATGVKLKKVVTASPTVTTTEYLSGFQYTNNVLQFFPTAEGYVRFISLNIGGIKQSYYQYIYNYTDHLGNIRLSYSKDPTTLKAVVVEEQHYYPFGLEHPYNKIEKDLISPKSGLKPTFGQKTENGYQYQYQGQERQDELNLNWDSFKWRNYDYAIGRFMCIDPLAEKYAYNGVYNFSENRVIDGFELEGLEVILLNPTKSASSEQQKATDQKIVNGAKNIPNSSTMITVTGHGSPRGMSNDVRGEKIRTAGQLNAVLSRNSDEWKNKESGEGMTVVLYSCRTGAELKNKDGSKKANSFAQTISASEEFKDVDVIAPDQRVYFTEDGLIGAFEAEYAGPDDEYKANAPDHSRSNTPGNWNVFKNGELIRSYEGDWKPTNKPSWWDKLTKEN